MKKTKEAKVMGEFKRKTLHSGKGGPVVKSRKQAIAIALSEAGKSLRASTNPSVRLLTQLRVTSSLPKKEVKSRQSDSDNKA